MSRITPEIREKNKKRRKKIDKIYNAFTLGSSFVGVLSLIAIVVFVFTRGIGLINFDIIFGDYYPAEYHLEVYPDEFCNCPSPDSLEDDEYYSEKWGVAFQIIQDKAGSDIVVISYLSEDSPLYNSSDIYGDQEVIYMKEGLKVNRITFDDGTIVISKYGPETIANQFEASDGISEIYLSGDGGGMRGSLISTLYLIGLTLLFALPLGILTAIYLTEYAKKGKVTNYLRQLIEMLTGVPSIIFGLVGLIVFIPITSIIGYDGKNLLAAAFTMTIIILPTIIRATEESLKVIPNDLRQASLALGANSTQTTFKVVLPNALPGILTATLLGIGRIIGESAALIFVLGTTINDHVTLGSPSTTLAVQIWSIMGGEVANFELASAISLIILAVVLILNLIVKYISYRLNKAWH
jgi:phosphate transport system permease protein